MSMEDINRLAALGELEYLKRRKDEAAGLNIPVGALDRLVKAKRAEARKPGAVELREVEPWPEPVDGDALLDGIVHAIRRRVAMPEGAAEAVALWAVHTHGFRLFQHTPRLHVHSPEKRCGKTTLLDVLEVLTPRAIRTENITLAPLFRLIDAHAPTLLIDEVDTFLANSEELRGALNAGHRRGGQMLRCEGDNNEVRAFRTFAPVALAGIGRLAGTLEDRSIRIELRRKTAAEKVEHFRPDRADDLQELASMAARWAADHELALAQADPDMPARLHDRAADNWRPLQAIADLAGGDWPERARNVAVMLSGGADDDNSVRVQLLADLRDMFETERADALPSVDICDALQNLEARPWPEWKGGKPITPRQLAKLLEPFAIRPGSIRTGTGTPKGYRREQFEDAFARYLPSQSATPPQPAENCEKPAISIRHNGQDVADEKPLKPAESLACGGVADEKGGLP